MYKKGEKLTAATISILIPVYNEEKFISACLDSVMANDFTDLDYEIFVIDGLSTDNTRSIVEHYAEKYPSIKLLDNLDRTVPYALNLGIKQSSGSYIVRLDAHAEYPTDYFQLLILWHQSIPEADNIGGLCETDVLKKGPTSKAIALVMSDRFGVGNSVFRTGIDRVKEVDTVPFGCFKRSVFERYGLFDIRLSRNQDIEFNKRLVNNGGKIFLVPEIVCKYYARDNYPSFAFNRFKTGMWIIKTAYFTRTTSSLSVRHFVPLVFVVSLILPSCLSTLLPALGYVSLLSLAMYMTVFSWRSVVLVAQDSRTSTLNVFIAFLTLHIAYGLGSVCGLFSVVTGFFLYEN